MSIPSDITAIMLDTSAAIDLLDEFDDAPPARVARRQERIPAAVRYAQEWVLPVPVVGELKFGALNSMRREANTAKVEAFMARCRIADSTAATAQAYADIRHVLYEQGLLIPENDLWIAASSLESRLPLATSDPHFDRVGGLDVHRT